MGWGVSIRAGVLAGLSVSKRDVRKRFDLLIYGIGCLYKG